MVRPFSGGWGVGGWKASQPSYDSVINREFNSLLVWLGSSVCVCALHACGIDECIRSGTWAAVAP